MKLLFILLVVFFFGDNLSLPAGAESKREDLVTRCILEVLSKVFSKPNATPVDPECKDILKSGLEHKATAKSNKESSQNHGLEKKEIEGREVNAHQEKPRIQDLNKDETEYIKEFLRAAEEKRKDSEDKSHHGDEEGDQEEEISELNHHRISDPSTREESEGDEEKEKRIWKPTEKYHYKNTQHSKEASNEESAEESSEEKRSESSEVNKDEDKHILTPTHRYYQTKHQRNAGSSEEESEEQSYRERRFEYSGESEERQKRILKPRHQHHHKKRRWSNIPSEVESGELNSEKIRSESSEESKSMEKRKWKPTHGHHHKKRSRDHSDEESEELSSTEKKADFSEDSEERNQHIWTPAHRYLHKELRRSGDSSEEEEGHSAEGEKDKKFRSDYRVDKRHHSAAFSKEVFKQHGMEDEKEKEKETRHLDKKGKSHHTKQNEKEKEENKAAIKYLLAKKKSEEQRDLFNEEEVMEKRSPWEYRGYYHPAWWKRNVVRVAAPEAEDKTRWLKERLPHHLPEKQHYAPTQMNQLAKLLNYKKAALAGQSKVQEEKQTLHQRPLTSKEEKELENLTAMDVELQKIAEKIHETQKD